MKDIKTYYLHFKRMRETYNADRCTSVHFTALKSGFAQYQARGATGSN